MLYRCTHTHIWFFVVECHRSNGIVRICFGNLLFKCINGSAPQIGKMKQCKLEVECQANHYTYYYYYYYFFATNLCKQMPMTCIKSSSISSIFFIPLQIVSVFALFSSTILVLSLISWIKLERNFKSSICSKQIETIWWCMMYLVGIVDRIEATNFNYFECERKKEKKSL